MMPPSPQAWQGRKLVVLGSRLLLLAALLMGVAPRTATALPIYQSAGGPLGDPFGPAAVIVQDQSLGVKFHVSKPVVAGSIGGYFAPYQSGVTASIDAAIVRLQGPQDFPDSFSLTTPDVVAKTSIDNISGAGLFAGDLALRLTGGWYALVFAAPGSAFADNAIMPPVYTDIGDPLYFFGTTVGLRDNAFLYRNGGGLTGVRMFLDTDSAPLLADFPMLALAGPVAPVPEPSTLLLLGSGVAGLGTMAWWRQRRR